MIKFNAYIFKFKLKRFTKNQMEVVCIVQDFKSFELWIATLDKSEYSQVGIAAMSSPKWDLKFNTNLKSC